MAQDFLFVSVSAAQIVHHNNYPGLAVRIQEAHKDRKNEEALEKFEENMRRAEMQAMVQASIGQLQASMQSQMQSEIERLKRQVEDLSSRQLVQVVTQAPVLAPAPAASSSSVRFAPPPAKITAMEQDDDILSDGTGEGIYCLLSFSSTRLS